MIKFLFLILLSLNLYGQDLNYGFYWFRDGKTSVPATGSNIAGYYDASKPTIIYFHGWQQGTSKDNYRRETFLFTDPTANGQVVDTAAKWIADGWNVGIFYWNQFADEDQVTDAEAKIWSTKGPRGMRYRLNTGAFSTVGDPTVSVGDLAYTDYKRIMANYIGTEIRFAGHSLGSQLATILAKKISNDGNLKLMPKRLELLDPFWSKNGKSFLGDTVNGTMTTSCETKGGSTSDWVAEVARCYIAKMISKNNLAVTWYKTSAIFDTGVGDGNNNLKTIVVFQNPSSGWWSLTQQTEKHIWARHLYFWSKIVPNSTSIPSYANTPITTIQSTMKLKRVYTQKTGTSVANPTDDTYGF